MAVRRVELNGPKRRRPQLDRPEQYALLPNTALCYTAEDAVRIAGWPRSWA